MDSNNIYGRTTFLFGFLSTDAPIGIPNFFPRSAEVKYEPETFNEAKDSQGITMFFTTVRNTKRKMIGTFTGYVETGFDPSSDAFPLSFTFMSKPWFVTNVSHPQPKGAFHEAVIEASSYGAITG